MGKSSMLVLKNLSTLYMNVDIAFSAVWKLCEVRPTFKNRGTFTHLANFSSLQKFVTRMATMASSPSQRSSGRGLALGSRCGVPDREARSTLWAARILAPCICMLIPLRGLGQFSPHFCKVQIIFESNHRIQVRLSETYKLCTAANVAYAFRAERFLAEVGRLFGFCRLLTLVYGYFGLIEWDAPNGAICHQKITQYMSEYHN